MFNLENDIPTAEEFEKEIKRMVQEIKKDRPDFTDADLAEQERVLKEVIFNLKTPAEAMGFSPQFIEALYAIGYQGFKSGDYDTAYPIFKFLSQMDPNKARYFSGMASIHFAKKEWDQAQYYFIASAFIDEIDPMPYFYAAECSIEKKDLLEALFYYRGVISRSKDAPQYAPLVQRAKMSIANIESIIPMEPRRVDVPSQ